MKDKCCKIKCEWKYDCNDIWDHFLIVLILLLLNIESIFGYIAAA